LEGVARTGLTAGQISARLFPQGDRTAARVILTGVPIGRILSGFCDQKTGTLTVAESDPNACAIPAKG
jgi:hypothetical protein